METVHLAEFESPIGPLRILSTSCGIAYLELPHANGRGLAGWLSRHAPEAKTVEAFAPNRAAIAQVLEYLEGKRTDFALPLDLRGTPFQREVWRELLCIPYGETRSYHEVARAIGEPLASRAVGGANGANPVALIVPCHRVVASDGLAGYAGGLVLKRRLLALERNRAAASKQGRLL
ncbi:MAG TPA: methylated-DNA--[protein]-cysteine S-methyltransferase [Myxococcota bacterium]|nr:methylated-DNA--[protein]-cysteine S-methyltransferase [Myxococcota bacterium]